MTQTSPASDKVTRKVILLSIVAKLDSLTRQELMQTAVGSMYMDYFQFSELLDELIKEKLVASTQRKNEVIRTAQGQAPERYSITTQGMKVLDTLHMYLPLPVSAYLERATQEREQELKDDRAVLTQMTPLPNGQIQVSLSLIEHGQRYFHIELDLPNEDIGRKTCQLWKEQASNLYPEFLRKLSSPANPTES